MKTSSQIGRIITVLKENPRVRFTARQLAEEITTRYSEDYVEKRNNFRFKDEKEFIQQIVAEIGSQKKGITQKDPHIFWEDKPRPRTYWYDPQQIAEKTEPEENLMLDEEETTSAELSDIFEEKDLYPILIEYLKTELNLYSLRIDEKTSSNHRGTGGNQWLHPDIVAMQPVDKGWDKLVRDCAKLGSGQSVRLWSFEVKKELNSSNTRMSFFQAVSNSSWANEGYLVTAAIAGNDVENELRMLSSLHGIGMILLNAKNPSESEIMLPARAKLDVDWQSVNRILIENRDFRNYIELVSMYYQTGIVRHIEWNK